MLTIMKLPNGERAELGDKLERYCLNSEHPKGKHKALLFQKRLGITLENKIVLQQALRDAAREGEAELYRQDRFSDHYDLEFVLTTEVGRSLVLSCWIVRKAEDFPRLTNTYPVGRKEG